MLKKIITALALVFLLAACYEESPATYDVPEDFILAEEEELEEAEIPTEEFIMEEKIYNPEWLELFYLVEEILQSGEQDFNRAFEIAEEKLGEERIKQLEDILIQWAVNFENHLKTLEAVKELLYSHGLTILYKYYDDMERHETAREDMNRLWYVLLSYNGSILNTVEAVAELFDDTGTITLYTLDGMELSESFGTYERAMEILGFLIYNGEHWDLDWEAFENAYPYPRD